MWILPLCDYLYLININFVNWISGKLTTVNFLIRNGACVDKQDIDGQTALHKAIQNKRYDLIKTLTDACPHITNIQDNKGNLPKYPLG